MKRVYVAGAYNADNIIDALGNMRRGMELSTKVLEAGFAPFCPWLDYHFSLMSDSITIQNYYDYSMAWLEVSDAILIVQENCETSNGTQAEMRRAEELDIPIFYNIAELIECYE